VKFDNWDLFGYTNILFAISNFMESEKTIDKWQIKHRVTTYMGCNKGN
jgi:hypothetical protein